MKLKDKGGAPLYVSGDRKAAGVIIYPDNAPEVKLDLSAARKLSEALVLEANRIEYSGPGEPEAHECIYCREAPLVALGGKQPLYICTCVGKFLTLKEWNYRNPTRKALEKAESE